MKKNILFLSIAMLFLISCSSDEAQQAPPEILNTNGTKLKKTVTTFNNGRNVATGNFFYNGDKLSRMVTSEGNFAQYSYSGDLITKIEYFSNNVSSGKQLFEYVNDKLTMRRQIWGNTGSKVVYTHNPDGTISIASYTGDKVNQTTQTDLNQKVFFENGQVSKIEDYRMINGVLEKLIKTYTYDTAIVPTSLIVGYDKMTTYEDGIIGNNHNITAVTYTTSVNNNIDVDVTENEYNTYNVLFKATAIDPYDVNGPPIITKYYYY